MSGQLQVMVQIKGFDALNVIQILCQNNPFLKVLTKKSETLHGKRVGICFVLHSVHQNKQQCSSMQKNLN